MRQGSLRGNALERHSRRRAGERLSSARNDRGLQREREREILPEILLGQPRVAAELRGLLHFYARFYRGNFQHSCSEPTKMERAAQPRKFSGMPEEAGREFYWAPSLINTALRKDRRFTVSLQDLTAILYFAAV